MAYQLQTGESISSGIRRILLERVNLIRVNLTDLPEGFDIGVHDARKNCKRVRAAYRLIRDEIGHPLYRQENIRFRDTARLLARARDTWVMIETLDKVVEPHREHLPSGAFDGLQQDLTDQYETTREKEIRNYGTIPMILETMDEASCQIDNLPIVNEDFSAFRSGIRRVYDRGRRGKQLAYAQPTAKIFHEWRKRVKYLWYQIEILEASWSNLLSQMAKDLHTLSEYLGVDHDLAVLRSTILESPASFRDERELLLLVCLIDQERLRLQTLAHPLGERLYFDLAEAFTERLEIYWQAWQSEDPAGQDQLIQQIQARSSVVIPRDIDLYTTSEMAVRLGISPDKVRRLIYDQKLPAEKVGAAWIIRANSGLSPGSPETPEPTYPVLLSTRQAAHRLGLSRSRVRALMRLGRLPAKKVGTYWLIRESDLPK
jgi:excisionase family DNA binding protein